MGRRADFPLSGAAPRAAENALAAARALLESVPAAGVIVADAQLRVVHLDGTLFARSGQDPEAMLGEPLAEAMGPELRGALGARCRAALAGERQSFEHWDGGRGYGLEVVPVHEDDGRVSAVVAVVQDVTDRTRASEALARSEARLREAERMVGVGSFELDLATAAITFSEGFRRLLGMDPSNGLDFPTYLEHVHRDDRDFVAHEVAAVVASRGSASVEYRIVRPDGTVRTLAVQGEIVTDAQGEALFLRGAALDVTEQREAERDRLEAASLFRRGFDDSPIGMVIIDPLNGRFEQVNDAMCHLLGRPREELLGTPPEQITHPDDHDVIGGVRQALVDRGASHYQAEKRYRRADGRLIWVSLHVTPVRRPEGSEDALFAQVLDITERKEHEAELEREVADAGWLRRIRRALDLDCLVLYSQPIVDLATGDTVQQELLLRMRDSDGSVIAPGRFLPVAERYGLIAEIDRWVVRQAAALAATGARAEFNLSGASIGDPSVLREIESAIESTGADPSLLVVEVTETAMMEHLEAGRAFAERLTALGCGLALDDFGTGFSGLTYLKHLPTQHLKIDIEFVRDLTRSATGERMVRGIVGLAHEFDLVTTAEGVEDETTLALLRELGVHRAQGYLLGRPQPLA